MEVAAGHLSHFMKCNSVSKKTARRRDVCECMYGRMCVYFEINGEKETKGENKMRKLRTYSLPSLSFAVYFVVLLW